jgi:ribosomal protein L16 Arg81 hydroxylase
MSQWRGGSVNIEGFDFTRLIQPISPDDFFAEYWEKKPLLIQRHDPGYYQSLISYQDMENYISRTDARYPAIKLVKKGATYFDAFYPPEFYTVNVKHGADVFAGMVDTDKVIAAYRAGSSVALPELHLSWDPLGALCATLEKYFDHAVRVNAYITPGNSKGFAPHYDTHEVIVLQIGGKKCWRVYEPPFLLPLVAQKFNPNNYITPQQPLLEVILEPGDLLYLPRGYVHAAATTPDSFSAHATIGITPYTWMELAAQMFMSCMESPRFRRALPPGFVRRGELKETLRQGLIEMLDELKENGDFDKFIDTFKNRVVSDRGRNQGSFQKSVFQCDVVVR